MGFHEWLTFQPSCEAGRRQTAGQVGPVGGGRGAIGAAVGGRSPRGRDRCLQHLQVFRSSSRRCMKQHLVDMD